MGAQLLGVRERLARALGIAAVIEVLGDASSLHSCGIVGVILGALAQHVDGAAGASGLGVSACTPRA